MQALRRRGQAVHGGRVEAAPEGPEGLDGRERTAHQDLSVRELLPDDGVRERAGLDLAPRGPPPRPRRALQQVPRRVLDPRHRRPVRERLHLRRQVRGAARTLKRVFSSFNQTAAYHARNLLEAEGIVVLVRNAMLSSAMGELPPAECQMELWVVDDADAARAEEALQRRISGPDWSCDCGEKLGPQFSQCWRCGAVREPGPRRRPG